MRSMIELCIDRVAQACQDDGCGESFSKLMDGIAFGSRRQKQTIKHLVEALKFYKQESKYDNLMLVSGLADCPAKVLLSDRGNIAKTAIESVPENLCSKDYFEE